jgi:HK97 family phage prohead protease
MMAKNKSSKKRIVLTTPSQLKKYGFHEPFNYDFGFVEKVKSKAKSEARRKESVKKIRVRKKKANGQIVPEEDLIIRGKASTNHKDRVGDVIMPEALRGASKDLLQKGSNTVFFNHDTDFPIGKVNKSDFNESGKVSSIDIEVFISKADDVADIRTKLREKVLNSFSIRLLPKKVEIVENAETGEIEEFNIMSMSLHEVSVVGIPCNEEASVDEVACKSFTKSISEYNKKIKQRTQKMPTKKKKPTKKSSKKRVGNKSADNNRLSLLEKGMETMMGAIGTLTESINASNKSKKSKSKAPKKGAPKKNKSIEEMTGTELLQELVSGKRKGYAESGTEETDDGLPKPAFKGPQDSASIEYAKYVYDNETVLEKLSDSEKASVKATYLSAYEVTHGN